MKNFVNNIFNAISDNLISGGAYYLIAKAAVVTILIILVAWVIAGLAGIGISYLMTYEKKVVCIDREFELSDDADADLLRIKQYFQQHGRGKYPEKFVTGLE